MQKFILYSFWNHFDWMEFDIIRNFDNYIDNNI